MDRVAAILAGRLEVQVEDGVQVARLEWSNRGIDRRVRTHTRHFEDLIARLEFEAHALVNWETLVRGHEDQASAAGRLQPIDHGVGQRAAETGPSILGLHPDRADPAHGPVRRPDASAHEAPIDLGDDRPALGLRRREFEPRPPVTPIRTEDRLGCEGYVAGKHRTNRRGGHPGHRSGGGPTLGYHRHVAGLSRSDVEHVAYLARLGMSPAELDRLQGQLNQILDQYAKLAELNTDAIPPTAQTIELENILRDDLVTTSLPQTAVLANAPLREGAFMVVPPILGGDGD